MTGALNELALFAGAGGGLLASHLLGWNTVAAVEIEKYPREVLLQRQRDGMLDNFPIWDDVCTFDGRPWRGLVDVVSGGFPCQDISPAGRGDGLAGARSGLWFEYLRIVEEVRPRFVFAENSSNLRANGLGTIIEGLTGLGYGARWGVLGAWHIGAPHKRNRMWVLAYSPSQRPHYQANEQELEGQRAGQLLPIKPRDTGDVAHPTETILRNPNSHSESTEPINDEAPGVQGLVADTNSTQRERVCRTERILQEHANTCSTNWWETEPALGRVANGVADRVDRLKAIGNGQVPAVAEAAFRILSGGAV